MYYKGQQNLDNYWQQQKDVYEKKLETLQETEKKKIDC